MNPSIGSPEQPLAWTFPQGRREAVESAFLRFINTKDLQRGHQKSIENPDWFWMQVIDFLEIPFLRPPRTCLNQGAHMADAQWFEGSIVNFAHACLAQWKGSTAEALVEETEDGTVTRWNGNDLVEEVQRGAGVLRDAGVSHGDRVVLLLPMSSQGVISYLSVAWLGAVAVPVFSGFGVHATHIRIVDSGAKLVVTQSQLTRRGRDVDLVSVANEASKDTQAEGNVVVWDGFAGNESTPIADSWQERALIVEPLAEPAPTGPEDPMMIAYTSGTTGKPKGVVHTHGGLTVKLAQEGAFQLDIQAGDRVTWMTDLGWIMSAWIIGGALINSATLFCYPGAPDFPQSDRIFDLARRHRLTAVGLSPSLVRGILAGRDGHSNPERLPDLLTFGSSGEPWTEAAWWWLFTDVGREQIPIVNFTGGTEVGACFLSVSLLQGIKPLSVGGPCWGMDVTVWNAFGEPVFDDVGELVCQAPWPSMARTVWGDHQRFLETYFDTWPDVWRHGDRASVDRDGFWTLHGRSDDVMNIAGKRLGPVEVEAAALTCPNVVQAAAVGVPHPTKGESIALFVVLDRPDFDAAIPEDVHNCVSRAVSSELGKAFSPSHVVVVPDLPRTRTAKTVRRAIRSIAIGEDPGDLSTVDNPEVLQFFRELDR